MPDGKLKPLTRHQPAAKVEDGGKGAVGTIDFVARQWASPSVKEQKHQKETDQPEAHEPEVTPKNRPSQASNGSIKKPPGFSILPRLPVDYSSDQPISLGHSMNQPSDEPMDLDMFLNRLKTHMFSISCMVFQDAWNLDLERVQDCCIHVFSPDDRLIPFCMYNLTDVEGRSLYRKNSRQ